MIGWAEQLRGLRILDRGADPLAHELGRGVVGGLVHQQVVVGIKVADAAALGPFRRIGATPLLLRRLERRLLRWRKTGDAERRIVGRAAALGILGFVLAFLLGIE